MSDANFKIGKFNKNAGLKDKLQFNNIIKKVDLFQGVSKNILKLMLEQFAISELQENTVIQQINCPMDNFFVVLSGNVGGFKQIDEDYEKQSENFKIVRNFKAGEYFGDLEIVLNKQSTQRLVALDLVYIAVLSADVFKNITKDTVSKRIQEKIDILRQNQVLSKFTQQQLIQVLVHIIDKKYQSNDVIYQEESDANYAYLVQSGEFTVTKKLFLHLDTGGNNGGGSPRKAQNINNNTQSQAVKKIRVGTYHQTDIFGFEDILNQSVRCNSVICSKAGNLMLLTKNEYINLINRLNNEETVKMEPDIIMKQQQQQISEILSQQQLQQQQQEPTITNSSELEEQIDFQCSDGQQHSDSTILKLSNDHQPTFATFGGKKKGINENNRISSAKQDLPNKVQLQVSFSQKQLQKAQEIAAQEMQQNQNQLQVQHMMQSQQSINIQPQFQSQQQLQQSQFHKIPQQLQQQQQQIQGLNGNQQSQQVSSSKQQTPTQQQAPNLLKDFSKRKSQSTHVFPKVNLKLFCQKSDLNADQKRELIEIYSCKKQPIPDLNCNMQPANFQPKIPQSSNLTSRNCYDGYELDLKSYLSPQSASLTSRNPEKYENGQFIEILQSQPVGSSSKQRQRQYSQQIPVNQFQLSNQKQAQQPPNHQHHQSAQLPSQQNNNQQFQLAQSKLSQQLDSNVIQSCRVLQSPPLLDLQQPPILAQKIQDSGSGSNTNNNNKYQTPAPKKKEYSEAIYQLLYQQKGQNNTPIVSQQQQQKTQQNLEKLTASVTAETMQKMEETGFFTPRNEYEIQHSIQHKMQNQLKYNISNYFYNPKQIVQMVENSKLSKLAEDVNFSFEKRTIPQKQFFQCNNVNGNLHGNGAVSNNNNISGGGGGGGGNIGGCNGNGSNSLANSSVNQNTKLPMIISKTNSCGTTINTGNKGIVYEEIGQLKTDNNISYQNQQIQQQCQQQSIVKARGEEQQDRVATPRFNESSNGNYSKENQFICLNNNGCNAGFKQKPIMKISVDSFQTFYQKQNIQNISSNSIANQSKTSNSANAGVSGNTKDAALSKGEYYQQSQSNVIQLFREQSKQFGQRRKLSEQNDIHIRKKSQNNGVF